MSKPIRWTPAAAWDLQNLSDYLRENHPQYRHATLRKVFSIIQSLKEWPYRGRIGRESATRELIVTPLPYIVVYRVNDQSIEVLRIYHTVQKRP